MRALDLAAEGWPPAETANLLSSLLFAPFDFPRKEFGDVLPSGRTGWKRFLGAFPPEAGGRAFDRALRFADAVQHGGRPEELLGAFVRFAPSHEELKLLVERAIPYIHLDERIREISLSIKEAEKKEQSLRELQRNLGEAVNAPLSFEEATAFLDRWAESASVWMPSPISPSISIYPGVPPSLATASVWILPGMTAIRRPGQLRESPLLSDDRKAALHESLSLERSHLPLVPEKRSQKEALFRRLAACGEDLCILLRPLIDGEGRPLPPSPFIESACLGSRPWLLESDAEPLVRPLGEIYSNDAPLAAEGTEPRPQSHSFPSVGRVKPEATSLPLPESRVFSLSDIDAFDSCPFRLYCNRVAELETPTEALYRHDLAGSALHMLWQRVWERALSTGERLVALARELFDDAMRAYYPRLVEDPALRRDRDETLRRVLRLARLQQGIEENGLAELRIEQRREYTLPEFEREGVRFRGRCDRIDVLRDGTAILFDYKSGASSRFAAHLQLAAYGISLAAEGAHPAASAYLCLRDGRVKIAALDGAFSGKFSPFSSLKIKLESLEELESRANEVLDRVATAYNSGLFSPNYDSKDCRHCGYASLCRKRDFGKPESEEDEEYGRA